ncbi:Glu/Leu/Phe/Val dehydrogenase dimerization domain-containing protein [Echinimonas agarilytica]|uniref:Glutamate/phenylalanine/leucine/valine/L-tryptophan dehydrogenase C-terminal domain-containing protein n=1 Tax=Echinimonas agarilytica TaxID=1215918 RepID=A0AA41W8Y1_9GAMM|nr:Glu/Leu/Phe/Val dehydrogenase dimerization domain-containing protein [Echinimonas agarilytica]MCM2680778.1 hypothetical protein [Echinimonas agarilytica]
MSLFDQPAFDAHEQVVFCHDQLTGLKAIIAIHDTRLGPATGGCRMWDYATEAEAINDVLRLAKGMTYKNAMANLPMGGGKAVIIGNSKRDKTPELMHAFGRHIERLGGRYVSAEDVGISPQDMAEAATQTAHIAGLEGKSGDPSPYTAYGTFLGIQAALKHQTGHESLAGKRVAVQGVGHVGYHLCRHLHQAGARLIVTDINQDALSRAAQEFSATVVESDSIYDQDVDIYAPCALGATINDNTLSRLKASIIAGAANNQLATEAHDLILKQRGILYAPDYVINAGGIINVSYENAYDASASKQQVEGIYQTLTDVFDTANNQDLPTGKVAASFAQQRLNAA